MEALREGLVHASPLVSSDSTLRGFPWLVPAAVQSLPVSAHGPVPCVCVALPPTGHMSLDLGTFVLHSDIIFRSFS